MNIMILGATGYLGGNIVKKLYEEKHNITCIVRKDSNLSGIEPFCSQYLSSEIKKIQLYLNDNSIDWIINCVCKYKSNDTLYADLLDSNIVFPLYILNMAIKYQVKGFLTIGTSLPKEFNHYSFSKHEFARIGRFLSETDGISFIELQPELFYGGYNEPDDRFLSSVKKRLYTNDQIPLTEGLQKRDIIRVEDVVNIISRLISSEYACGCKTLPVGTGESHSIMEIVSFMKELIRSDSELMFGSIPIRKGEPDTCADISWYKNIDYSLRFGYFDGIKDWIKKI